MDLYQSKYTGEEMDAMFNKVNNSKVIAGNFTDSNSTLRTIELGFEPDLVFVYTPDNNNELTIGSSTGSGISGGYVPRILTKAYLSSYGKIISNGFTFQGKTTNTLYYIAIKF